MRLMTPLLKRMVYPGLSKAGYLRRNFGPGPAVLTYHGVLPDDYAVIDPDLDGNLVSLGSFRKQLRLLKESYNVIHPEEFRLWQQRKLALPPRSVLLTCDDGLQNCLTGMVPILHELRLSCLFFVTGDSLRAAPTVLWYDELYLMFLAVAETLTFEALEKHWRARGRQQKRPLWWNLVCELSRCDPSHRQLVLEQIREQLELPANWISQYLDRSQRCRFLLLNRAELLRLTASGMCLGSHTTSHPVLSQCTWEQAWDELAGSRKALERELCGEVWAMAYPFGDPQSVTAREIDMTERAGFACAFVNAEHRLPNLSEFALPRVNVTRSMTLPEFEAHVSGFHSSLKRLVS